MELHHGMSTEEMHRGDAGNKEGDMAHLWAVVVGFLC
jgi:hypothetical protein